jgi:hypothetical protein
MITLSDAKQLHSHAWRLVNKSNRLAAQRQMKRINYKLIGMLLGGFTCIAQPCPISFQPTVNYTLTASPGGVVAADFNGDGNIDLATNNTDTVLIFPGSASGAFSGPTGFPSGNDAADLLAVDLNGDSKPDLVTPNYAIDSLTVLINAGSGSFNAPVTFPVAPGPVALAAGDLNGDTKTDVVITASNTDSVTVLLGDGAGGFSSVTDFLTGAQPTGVVVADFNNDGDSDIVTSNQGSNTISLLLGDGTGNFAAPLPFNVSGSVRKITCGDFNSDGNMDVATSHFAFPQVSVLLGTGTGSFSAFVNYNSAVGAVCYSITAADFDTDGITDLAVPNNSVNTAAVLAGSGAGTFAAGVGFPVQTVPISIAHADFNLDGKEDLAVGNIGGHSISVLINNTNCATGMEENANNEISIAPNPFSDRFTLHANSAAISFELYNSEGKRIRFFSFMRDPVEIDLRSEASGIYFIRSTDGSFGKKIIKE